MKITLQIVVLIVAGLGVGCSKPKQPTVIEKYRADVAACEAQENTPEWKALDDKIQDMCGPRGCPKTSCKDSVLEHLAYADRMTVLHASK